MQGRNFWVLLSLVILTLSASVQAVVIDGRDWRQPADTVGFSWDDLATIFDPQTGLLRDPSNTTLTRAIDGAVIDFAGWTWASVYEVGDMFAAAGLPGCNDPCSIHQASTTWAPAFIDIDSAGAGDDGLFNATAVVIISYSTVHALSRTAMPSMTGMVFSPKVMDFHPQDMSGIRNTSEPSDANFRSSNTGVWLFRDVTSVPAPAPIGLFALGALAFWPRFSRTGRPRS